MRGSEDEGEGAEGLGRFGSGPAAADEAPDDEPAPDDMPGACDWRRGLAGGQGDTGARPAPGMDRAERLAQAPHSLFLWA